MGSAIKGGRGGQCECGDDESSDEGDLSEQMAVEYKLWHSVWWLVRLTSIHGFPLLFSNTTVNSTKCVALNRGSKMA